MTDRGLPLVALRHEAKYAIRAGELARLLGITVPDGGTVAVEHVSPDSGRTTAIGPDHLLAIRVSWEDPPPGEGEDSHEET